MSIFGAGGGGGGKAYVPTEAKDNLDSTSYVKIVELLSEGEIEGFATPSRAGLTRGTTAYDNAAMKDMYFDNTPILRAGASNTAPQLSDFNFKNVTATTRYGTQDQSYVSGFDAVENEVSVNANVVFATPITRTITDTDVDAVRITISVPVLQEITSKGDIIGSSLQLRISIRYGGGSYTATITDTITGRTADLYQRDYIVNLSWPIGITSATIKVERLTADSVSAKISNAFSWFSYTELIYQKLRYPNTAYVALRLDAEQFGSIPSRSYKIRGIKVRIPNNATVDINTGRLTYSGVWNGTFGAAKWTTDPAWILWDLLTSSRFGLGDHIQESTLDKWAFFSASKYCNELVPTGLNSPTVEPRFSCNVNIQTQEEAYKVINDMCSVFRAMPFWAAGSLTVAQDKPSDPVALFSLANVSEDGFNYEGSSLKTRATVVIVAWLNLDLGDIDREVIEDSTGIAKYGVITKEVSAFACTSRAQAHRIGEWLLYSERYEGEVISFTTSLETGIVLRPGSIIEVADPVKAGARRAGRISAATSMTVTLDDATDLPATGTISVVLADAIVQSFPYSSIAGNVVTITGTYDVTPQAGALWLIEDSTIQPTQWRVLSVQEQDGINYAVTGISYNSSKYDYIERGAALEARTISILNVPPDTPTDLTGEEVQYVLNNRVATKLALSWKPVRGVNEYRLRWRGEFDNWKNVTLYGPIYEIEDITVGNYQVEVYAISATQIVSSNPAEMMFSITGVGAPPANPTGVSLVPINDSTAIIQWDLATDLDVLVGGEVLIRHDPRNMPTAEWASSNAIVQSAAGNQTQKQVPLLAGTYFVAFRDQSGVRSVTPVGIHAILPTPQPRLSLKVWTEQNLTPKFDGTKTNFVYDSGKVALYLNPATALTGTYVYKDTLDLTQVYDINIRRRVVSYPVSTTINFDSVTGNFDDQPGNFDGSDLDQVNCVTYVRTTNDNPSGTPTWGPWNEFVNAVVRARAIQIRVIGTTQSNLVGLAISELGATAELQQRVESGTKTGANNYTVTFAEAFYQTPNIIISPSNMATGDYYTVTAASRTGFTVNFYNSANAGVTRSCDYTATGYGREIV